MDEASGVKGLTNKGWIADILRSPVKGRESDVRGYRFLRSRLGSDSRGGFTPTPALRFLVFSDLAFDLFE